MLMWFSPSSVATSASAPGRLGMSRQITSVSVIGRFSFVSTARASAGSATTIRSTPCSCESTSVIAMMFCFACASAPVTCASTPGLLTRNTENCVAVFTSGIRPPAQSGSHDSKDFDGLALRRLDRQHPVQPRDLDQLHQLRPDAAQDELAVLQRGQLLVQLEHDADRLAREVLDLLEVEHEPAAVLLVDEAVQLLPDLFEQHRVHQRRRAEFDDGEFFDGLDGEMWAHSTGAPRSERGS